MNITPELPKLPQNKDDEYFKEIGVLKQKFNLSERVILENYMAFIQRRSFSQTLAYYELFKIVKDLPGSIAEVGVFLGNGLFTWSKLQNTFQPTITQKKVFGFDNFSGYKSDDIEENKYIDYINNIHDSHFIVDQELIFRLVELNQSDTPIVESKKVKIYAGELSVSLDKFINEFPGVRLNLLMIDVNLYSSTSLALEKLFNLVVRGGVICFRGYGCKPWEGESKAVDEFIESNKFLLRSLYFSNFPSAYIIKS